MNEQRENPDLQQGRAQESYGDMDDDSPMYNSIVSGSQPPYAQSFQPTYQQVQPAYQPSTYPYAEHLMDTALEPPDQLKPDDGQG